VIHVIIQNVNVILFGLKKSPNGLKQGVTQDFNFSLLYLKVNQSDLRKSIFPQNFFFTGQTTSKLTLF
jgi:hypothetical protein